MKNKRIKPILRLGFLLITMMIVGQLGLAQEPYLVKDIWPGTDYIDLNFQMVNVNGTLYFRFDDGVHGRELWKSDGTSAGTVMVKDLWPGTGSSMGAFTTQLTNVNGTLFFRADDGIHGVELWKSDGTAAGTVMVNDIWPGAGSSNPDGLTAVNGMLFFSARDGGWLKLWKSDGTAAGTVIMKDGFVILSHLTNVNGTLFFVSEMPPIYSNELWKSDGTTAGTVKIKDTPPTGSQLLGIQKLTNVNGVLFFAAYDVINGLELWKSNGTEAGTVLVKNIDAGVSHSYPNNLTNVNGTLFFSATDYTHGGQLWKSDGTEAGTVMITNIDHSLYPWNMTNFNGTLFFAGAVDPDAGAELCKSDGTTLGTVMVKDIWPGYDTSLGSGFHSYFANVGGTFFFGANDGTHGWELWKSDGTEVGTVLVKDIMPGAGWSYPSFLTDVNGMLFLIANDGLHGFELWALAVTPQAQFRLLISTVQSLVTTGNLSQGGANALLAKLNVALANFNNGATNASCNQLQAFINQVNAFVRIGMLSETEGQSLLTGANNIRNSIGC